MSIKINGGIKATSIGGKGGDVNISGKDIEIGNIDTSSSFGEAGKVTLSEASQAEMQKNLSETKEVPTVVILTAIPEEYNAVKKHLHNSSPANQNATVYEKGAFVFGNKKIADVIIRECGQKNPTAAQEAERAINYFNPDCMFFVGIGGSMKPQDYSLGDVIFPEKIYYYEPGKADFDGYKSRGDAESPTYDLIELAKQERNKNNWKQLIKNKWPKDVKANIGVIASGEQLLEHMESDLGKLIKTVFNDAAVIEMEGFGFTRAVIRQGLSKRIAVGVVRGISDVVEVSTEKIADITNRRPDYAKDFASDTASAFAFWLIYQFYCNYEPLITSASPANSKENELHELEKKKIRLSVRPRLALNGGGSRGYEGELQINLLNKGELAKLKHFKILEGDVILHNEHLPYELEKNGERKIFLRTKDRSNSNFAKYKVEIEYEDALDFKYKSVVEGEGANCRLIETVEI